MKIGACLLIFLLWGNKILESLSVAVIWQRRDGPAKGKYLGELGTVYQKLILVSSCQGGKHREATMSNLRFFGYLQVRAKGSDVYGVRGNPACWDHSCRVHVGVCPSSQK